MENATQHGLNNLSMDKYWNEHQLDNPNPLDPVYHDAKVTAALDLSPIGILLMRRDSEVLEHSRRLSLA